MFGRRAASVGLHAITLVTLVSTILVFGETPLVVIPEHDTLVDEPPPQRNRRLYIAAGSSSAASGSSNLVYTGPVDRDLYPPNPSAFAPPAGRPTSSRPHQVPVVGLVRGQKGKLVPYRLKGPIKFLNENRDPPATAPFGAHPNERPWRWPKTIKPDVPPANNEQMRRLLRKNPSLTAVFDRNAKPDSSAVGKTYKAVLLPGQGVDAKTLDQMFKTRNAFYVQGRKGKMWYFHTADGKSFTYTDRIEKTERRFVRKLLFDPPVDLAHMQPTSSAAASPDVTRTAGQTSPKYGIPWLKAMFKKPTAMSRYVHSL